MRNGVPVGELRETFENLVCGGPGYALFDAHTNGKKSQPRSSLSVNGDPARSQVGRWRTLRCEMGPRWELRNPFEKTCMPGGPSYLPFEASGAQWAEKKSPFEESCGQHSTGRPAHASCVGEMYGGWVW